MNADIIGWLATLLGTEIVRTAAEDLIPYGFDGTAALKQRPLAVVFPKDATEVSAVLKLACENRVPVVTRGNVAENSGGLRGLKYGVTRDHVMGLEVVQADGTICWLGNKCVGGVAGYNLRDLFIGREGTLGVITRVLLKPRPKPAAC